MTEKPKEDMTATEIDEAIKNYKGPLPGDKILEDLVDSAVEIARRKGLARASKLGLLTGLDTSHRDQGSNFSPRGWGRR